MWEAQIKQSPTWSKKTKIHISESLGFGLDGFGTSPFGSPSWEKTSKQSPTWGKVGGRIHE